MNLVTLESAQFVVVSLKFWVVCTCDIWARSMQSGPRSVSDPAELRRDGCFGSGVFPFQI